VGWEREEREKHSLGPKKLVPLGSRRLGKARASSHCQSFLISNDHSHCRYVVSSSSTNLLFTV
jgi:hypothetical protein